MIEAKVIEDSISEAGKRITTLQIALPKVLLAELNTHRVFSRNFSSSRAIPVSRLVDVQSFEPLFYGQNQAGMQSKLDEIDGKDEAQKIWKDAIEYCKQASLKLSELGLHKQWANRLNDWHTIATGIVTSTEWDNFFALRDHPDAQPEICELAQQMRRVMDSSDPTLLKVGEWHLPYITESERSDSFFKIEANRNMLKKISAARCCRVSYLKHDGAAPNVNEDLDLFMRLAGSEPRHLSPLEHQATPDVCGNGIMRSPSLYGNFKGWIQYRQLWERNMWDANN